MDAIHHEFNLLGQKIVIKSKDEAELATLAIKIVNEKVAEIQEKNPLLGPQQIAILGLLEVAGSMVKDRKAIDEYRQELDRKCSSLMTEMSKIGPTAKTILAV